MDQSKVSHGLYWGFLRLLKIVSIWEQAQPASSFLRNLLYIARNAFGKERYTGTTNALTIIAACLSPGRFTLQRTNKLNTGLLTSEETTK